MANQENDIRRSSDKISDSESITFIAALSAKYCSEEAQKIDEVVISCTEARRRVAEYVGFDRVLNRFADVTKLTAINLADRCIEFCRNDLDLEITEKFRAESLDLSQNRIPDWRTVSDIISLFTDSLSDLVLSKNPLLSPLLSTEKDMMYQICVERFRSLRTIVLGDCAYRWCDIEFCAQNIWCAAAAANDSRLQCLHLFRNRISSLSTPSGQYFDNLTFLSLSENPIDDWREICKLGCLKRLKTLELSRCQIKSIRFDDDDDDESHHDCSATTDKFVALECLDLMANQIADWRSIAELNRLPRLEKLLLRTNPLYDSHPYAYNFNFVLSRIARLRCLDREPITKEARNDAEKYYLRTIFPQFRQISTDSTAAEKRGFLLENPCFERLLARLGEPVIATVLTKQEKIKQNFIVLKIVDEENCDASKRKIEKQVPKSTKVSNLKLILRRLLRIEMRQDFELIIESSDYRETMQDRDDICTYRFEPAADHVIRVKRISS